MSETNPLLMRCPDCGNEMSKRAAVCPKCGAPNDAQAQSPAPAPAPAPASAPAAPAGKTCPKCGATVSKFASTCPACDEPLVADIVSAEKIQEEQEAKAPVVLNHNDLHALAQSRRFFTPFICIYVIILLFGGIVALATPDAMQSGADEQLMVMRLGAIFTLLISIFSLFVAFFSVKIGVCLKRTWTYVLGIWSCFPFTTLLAIVVLDQFSWYILKKSAKNDGLKPADYAKPEYGNKASANVNLCLYEPQPVITWSTFLTPVFGAALVRENYRTLEEPAKAQKSLYWLCSLSAYYLLITIFFIYMPEKPEYYSWAMAHVVASISWFCGEALPQMKFLSKFKINYAPRDMKKPFWIAFVPAFFAVYLPYLIIVLYITFCTSLLLLAE